MTLKEVQDLMACGFSADEIRGFMAEGEKTVDPTADPKTADPYKQMLDDFKQTQAAMLKTLETIQQANLANVHQPEPEKVDVNKSLLATIIPPSALK